MGYTSKSIELVNRYLREIKSVCDFGAQNNYSMAYTGNPPYMSEWYKNNQVEYMAIDLNGENDAKQWDLSEPVKSNKQFDLVADFGTSEHVKDLYQCMANANKLCKVGGLMIHENPKVGNWPKHGFHYRDKDFYYQLAEINGYQLEQMEEHPAMGNTTDGWNIIAVMRKTKEGFVSREQFPKSYTE